MTPEEYAQKIFDDAEAEAFDANSKAACKKAITAVISAAVSAEHQRTLEQCAKVATEYHSDDCDDQCCTCRPIAAAIRALP